MRFESCTYSEKVSGIEELKLQLPRLKSCKRSVGIYSIAGTLGSTVIRTGASESVFRAYAAISLTRAFLAAEILALSSPAILELSDLRFQILCH